MHDVGTQPAQKPDQPREGPGIVAVRLVKLEDTDLRSEVGAVGAAVSHAEDRMALPRPRGIHEVHDAGLQATDLETVDDVNDEHRLAVTHALQSSGSHCVSGGPSRRLTEMGRRFHPRMKSWSFGFDGLKFGISTRSPSRYW